MFWNRWQLKRSIRNDGVQACAHIERAAESGWTDCAPLLRETLGSSGLAIVREAAARALGTLQDEAALEVLSAATTDVDSSVRRAALDALGALGPIATVPLLDALGRPDIRERDLAVDHLGSFGPDAVEPLLEALGTGSPTMRTGAALALARNGHLGAARRLAHLAIDPETRVRLAAVRALGHFGEAGVEPLIDALSDTEHSVSREAAHSLVMLGELATEALTRILQGSEPQARRRALEALRRIDDPAAIPVLLECLEDRDDRVRVGAAAILGQSSDPLGTAAIMEALSHKSTFVAMTAAAALGRIGDPMSVPTLIQALRTPRALMRKVLVDALSKIGDRRAMGPLWNLVFRDPDDGVRDVAALAVAENRWYPEGADGLRFVNVEQLAEKARTRIERRAETEGRSETLKLADLGLEVDELEQLGSTTLEMLVSGLEEADSGVIPSGENQIRQAIGDTGSEVQGASTMEMLLNGDLPAAS